jgi:hypothetical protein
MVVPSDWKSKEPESAAVVIKPPDPEEEALIILFGILFSYKITQDCPEGIVTDTPESIEIGPTLKPFFAVDNV